MTTPNAHSDNQDSATLTATRMLADSLCAAGFPTAVVGTVYQWDRLVVETDLGDLTLFSRNLQRPFTGESLYPCEVGLPRGLDWFNLDDTAEPDSVIFFPAGADALTIIGKVLGLLGPDRNSILNDSALRHMEALNGGFPSSALVMLKHGEDQLYAKYFMLWRQLGAGRYAWHTLSQSHSPFDAAREAYEVHGCSPTVYRCHSGNFIAFRPTIATPFI